MLTESLDEIHNDNVGIVPHSIEHHLFAIEGNVEILDSIARLQVGEFTMLART
jgi:hypothetical protein